MKTKINIINKCISIQKILAQSLPDFREIYQNDINWLELLKVKRMTRTQLTELLDDKIDELVEYATTLTDEAKQGFLENIKSDNNELYSDILKHEYFEYLDHPNSNTEISKRCQILLDEIIRNQQDNNYINISISEELKYFINNNIKLFSKGHNYLIFKLLYSGPPSKMDLLNFLFYLGLIDKKMQELFIVDPDKFGKTFIFPISPNLLPSVNFIFTNSEIKLIEKDIELSNKIDQILIIKKSELQNIFPKSFRIFNMLNKFFKTSD